MEKILLIAHTVDHGTRSIADAYERMLSPWRRFDVTAGLKQMGFLRWLRCGLEIRRTARDADVVISLHHGALCLGALFLPKFGKLRRVAITDWTRAFPSRRRDLYIRTYNMVYAVLCKGHHAVFSPAPGLRRCYEGLVAMRPTIYPLPYPEIRPSDWPERQHPVVGILYVGANIRRKGGDVLLSKWRDERPCGAKLTFVSPHAPAESSESAGVEFLTNISANTPEHRRLFEQNDIFLMPTRHDAYGFAALEAINFGLIVVTTEAAGIAELVREAGGLVGQTPEEAVELAFQLAQDTDNIRLRRAKVARFMADYPERLDIEMRQMLAGDPVSCDYRA
jgi:glycosyltransferase involved in cell wall biosynthesis